MSLDTVDAKLSKKEYQTLKDVVADIGQIFNNAKRCEYPLISQCPSSTASNANNADNVKESLLFAYAKKLHVRSSSSYLAFPLPLIHGAKLTSRK